MEMGVIMKKYCTFCNLDIDLDDTDHWYIRPNDGKYECKRRRHANTRASIARNKDHISEIKKKWQIDNKDKISKYQKEWRETSVAWKEYQPRKRELAAKYEKSNPGLKLCKRVRHRLWDAIKGNSPISIWDTIGCSTEELREHIEKLFQPNMTWDNYGELWVIDHIEPLCSFDLSDEEQIKKANNFMNLRPLLKSENAAKSSEDKKKRKDYV